MASPIPCWRQSATFGVLLLAVTFGLRAQQGTAAITGVVVDAATGRPIAGATVTLEERVPGSPPRPRAVQVTTPKGRFALADLAPSDTYYFLTATKPGLLDGGYGRIDPRGPGAPISLKDGQWLADVRLTMSPPGSISGTVVDERSEPVVGAYVRVLPQVMIAGRSQLLAGVVTQTDDRGAYRLAGLGPGKYLVSVPSIQATLPASATIKAPTAMAGTSMADLSAAGNAANAEKLVVDVGGGQQLVVGRYAASPPPTSDGQRTAYPITFFPGVTTPAEASTVELRVSEDRSGIDIQMQPVRTCRVSGIVDGPPDAVGNQLLRLVPIGLDDLGQGSEAATTVTLADGRFTFIDVPSGSYVLELRHAFVEFTYTSLRQMPTSVPAPIPFPARVASAGGMTAAPPGVEVQSLSDATNVNYWARQRLDLGGRDQDNVVVTLRKPAKMTGRIVWALDSKPSSYPPRPSLEPADGRRALGVLQVGLSRFDSSGFTIDGMMSGEYVLRVSDAAIEAIEWNGQNYTNRSFDAKAGNDILDVIVTVTTNSSSISGIVSDGTASLNAGAAVIAFPVEQEGWSNYGLNPARLKSALTTIDGRFRLAGLPKGDYYLLAVPASQERAWLDPTFLAARAGRALHVQIDRSDATISNVALSLVR